MKNLIQILAVFTLVSGCASSTEEGAVGADRRQLLILPSSQIASMSAQAYDQTKDQARKKGALDRSSAQVQRVQEIMRRVVPQTAVFRKEAPGWECEVHVISSEDINAYCIPGGKIIFDTVVIEKFNLTDGEIAAIMGHEI